ncbi:hypothetical protein BDZ94DRAFT_1238824 [Collybia nuda]|uniref:Uncharacterized protein n=1 Tax=Collybia nuda TaxID=64659 RepID=A0A9P5Y2B5_9AGAR|nr:hypothetical protein BDZ94DRAFT_1238824 [Collybia nuda]
MSKHGHREDGGLRIAMCPNFQNFLVAKLGASELDFNEKISPYILLRAPRHIIVRTRLYTSGVEALWLHDAPHSAKTTSDEYGYAVISANPPTDVTFYFRTKFHALVILPESSVVETSGFERSGERNRDQRLPMLFGIIVYDRLSRRCAVRGGISRSDFPQRTKFFGPIISFDPSSIVDNSAL